MREGGYVDKYKREFKYVYMYCNCDFCRGFFLLFVNCFVNFFENKNVLCYFIKQIYDDLKASLSLCLVGGRIGNSPAN